MPSVAAGNVFEPGERGANCFVPEPPCDHLHASQDYAGAPVEVRCWVGEFERPGEVVFGRAISATGLGERSGTSEVLGGELGLVAAREL
jgi:hypothetical protein